ncbi:hypothetical protein BSU00_06565 [Tenacibaculum sp. SG-28]|nr:hypothetical protein BSU00_06565 [Tenacibaculum sp. SG-28]
MKRILKRILLTAILILYIGDFYGQEKEEGHVYDEWHCSNYYVLEMQSNRCSSSLDILKNKEHRRFHP